MPRTMLPLLIGLLFFALSLSVFIPEASAQDVSAEAVDALFAEWDAPGSPGCAVAVIHEGEIVYENGYGLADLEHGVPITPKTVFYSGSVSKQFVAMSIALLAEQGKLSFDDDISEFSRKLQQLSKEWEASGLRENQR